MSKSLLQPQSPDERRKRMELVLEGTRLGMWDWNPQTNEVIFDERWAAMLGHSLDDLEFTYDAWYSRVHPDDVEACLRDIQAHLKGETDFYENVHRMRHKDGHWVHILDRGRIMDRDEQGRPTRFTGAHTDISAQREAELRARELARARTQFLAVMSHEIRTPLHGMLGITHLLKKTELSDEQQRLLEIVESSGESLLLVINDILDFAKADERRLSLSPHAFEVRAMLTGIANLFGPRAKQKGLRFSCTAAPGLQGAAWGDGHRLRQILINLVSNAIKFTERGGVALSARREGESLHFEVVDTGVGVADTERIFLAFEQEDASITRRYAGTGLGLAIVRLLAEQMGGEVGVSSTVGEGSRFWLRVPMRETQMPQMEEVSRDQVESLPAMRVLVADDNAINQMVIRGMLAAGGHFCQTVDTGRQALACVEDSDWDCIFLDLYMPDMGGEEAAERMRAAGVRTRIVAASADASVETQERCRAKGIQGFLSKPFKRLQLLEELRQAHESAP
ncbi:PAS domain-containing hybrid sensor histidine kinase/response regulator [Haliangium ochraceum]|uniref:histidine kinase n=1 Tax=Haliangium ochraceum (strain DSM 14365 / JCM 11303 / SMP-2) TaxID=502025 RepID=D0LSW1_HALO1|nr:PAS domain-containing hybrid sensor histidine kinase/response regulator [Haliangium ochraceum]ACY17333.1 PAS/PAC sensor hybrid histidine kinase [Haliangium ochraceum DSM 14365]